MSDVITALAHSAAGICQYGRGLTIGDDLEPCRAWANHLVHVTTDTGEHRLSLCQAHSEQLHAIAGEGDDQ